MCVHASSMVLVGVQVLRDLVKVIRPNSRNAQLNGWQLKYLLRLDGVQQQQKVPAVCNLSTGVCAVVHCVRAVRAPSGGMHKVMPSHVLLSEKQPCWEASPAWCT